jgi:hypothetical protein
MVVGGVCVDVVTAGTDGVRDSCAQCGRVWGGWGEREDTDANHAIRWECT